MTVRLTRTSHGGQPQSTGLEVDDDGHATGYQTSGNRVGRFARELTAAERKALNRALTAARDAGAEPAPDPDGRPKRPSGATEQLVADGLADVRFDPHDKPPTAVKGVIKRLLTLRENLTDSPVAAIELEVGGTPLGARLRHLGSEPVPVRMGSLTLQATLFGPDSAIIDTVTHTVDASGTQSPVGEGWVLPITDDLGLSPPQKGGFLTVTLGTPEVDALGDGVLRPARFSWMTE